MFLHQLFFTTNFFHFLHEFILQQDFSFFFAPIFCFFSKNCFLKLKIWCKKCKNFDVKNIPIIMGIFFTPTFLNFLHEFILQQNFWLFLHQFLLLFTPYFFKKLFSKIQNLVWKNFCKKTKIQEQNLSYVSYIGRKYFLTNFLKSFYIFIVNIL